MSDNRPAGSAIQVRRSRLWSLLAVLFFTTCISLQPLAYDLLWPAGESFGDVFLEVRSFADVFYVLLFGLLLSVMFYLRALIRSFRNRTETGTRI